MPTDEGAVHQLYLTQNVYKAVLHDQLPHKFANLSFIITNMKNKLTDSCGN